MTTTMISDELLKKDVMEALADIEALIKSARRLVKEGFYKPAHQIMSLASDELASVEAQIVDAKLEEYEKRN